MGKQINEVIEYTCTNICYKTNKIAFKKLFKTILTKIHLWGSE